MPVILFFCCSSFFTGAFFLSRVLFSIVVLGMIYFSRVWFSHNFSQAKNDFHARFFDDFHKFLWALFLFCGQNRQILEIFHGSRFFSHKKKTGLDWQERTFFKLKFDQKKSKVMNILFRKIWWILPCSHALLEQGKKNTLLYRRRLEEKNHQNHTTVMRGGGGILVKNGERALWSIFNIIFGSL